MFYLHISTCNKCNANYWQIYIVADNTVLKINPSNIGTSASAIETIIGEGSSSGGSDEIIGISISIWSSSLFITIKNHGLFAYTLSGQLLWSVGPVLYRSGYRQGCKKNITDCYFTSAPVIDQCEGSVYVSFYFPTCSLLIAFNCLGVYWVLKNQCHMVLWPWIEHGLLFLCAFEFVQFHLWDIFLPKKKTLLWDIC